MQDTTALESLYQRQKPKIRLPNEEIMFYAEKTLPRLVMNLGIEEATLEDADTVAVLVKELLNEIIEKTGIQHFTFDIEATELRCRQFIKEEKYVVYKAIDLERYATVGLLTLCESHSLYAEGTFGTVQEFYVKPSYRSRGIGTMLLDTAKVYAKGRGWKRLELCTPPVPEFDSTVSFYKCHNFAVTGGKKMKCNL